jgi:hypothetical protein
MGEIEKFAKIEGIIPGLAENDFPVISANHDMKEGSEIFDSGFPGHTSPPVGFSLFETIA